MPLPYQLWILCRREPVAPPGGWGTRVEGIDTRCKPLTEPEYFLGIELDASFRYEVYLRRDDSRPTGDIHAIAAAFADAADGIVVSRMPVTIPHRFALEYTAKNT